VKIVQLTVTYEDGTYVRLSKDVDGEHHRAEVRLPCHVGKRSDDWHSYLMPNSHFRFGLGMLKFAIEKAKQNEATLLKRRRKSTVYDA